MIAAASKVPGRRAPSPARCACRSTTQSWPRRPSPAAARRPAATAARRPRCRSRRSTAGRSSTPTLADSFDSPQAYDTIKRLRTALHAVPGADARSAATRRRPLDVQTPSVHDRNLIIPIVLVVIFLVLALLLRALLAPVLLIATVVLSFPAALGVCGFVFNHLFHFAGADQSFPLFAFVFLVALGHRLQHLPDDPGPGGDAAVRHPAGILRGCGDRRRDHLGRHRAGRDLRRAGGAAAGVPGRDRFAVAFGVLLDTILVRSILVPALATDIGKKIWWPSKLARGRGLTAGPRGRAVTGLWITSVAVAADSSTWPDDVHGSRLSGRASCWATAATAEVWAGRDCRQRRARWRSSGSCCADAATGGRARGARAEAALLAALDHPNLIRLQRLLLTPTAAWCWCWNWPRAGRWPSLLRRRDRLTPAEVAAALSPVAAALAYAHDEGVLHGDISAGEHPVHRGRARQAGRPRRGPAGVRRPGRDRVAGDARLPGSGGRRRWSGRSGQRRVLAGRGGAALP